MAITLLPLPVAQETDTEVGFVYSLSSSSLSSRSYENEEARTEQGKKLNSVVFQTVVAKASASHKGALNILLMLV